MRFAAIALSVLLVTRFGFSSAESQTVTFQQGNNGYEGCNDSELRNPLQHYENGPGIEIIEASEHCSACPICRIAIRFDLTSIPSHADVESATLELFPDFFEGGAMTGNYSVFQIAQPWKDGEATWEQPADNLYWANPGGDFIATVVTKTIVPRQTEYAWISFNVKPLVQTYISKPSINYGFLIINSLGAQAILVNSSESKNTELRPRLTVTYTVDPNAVVKKNVRQIDKSTRIFRRTPNGIHFFNQEKTAQQASITRINGTTLSDFTVSPGQQRLITDLAPGVYIVSSGIRSAKTHSIVTLP